MLGEGAINQSGMEDVARPRRNRAALSFSMELSPHSNGGGRVGRCCSFVRLQRRARRFILCISAMIQSCGNVHAANIPTLVASVVLFVLRRHGVKAVGDVTAGPSGTGGARMTASAAERTPLAEACHGGMLGPAGVLIHRISPCNPRTILCAESGHPQHGVQQTPGVQPAFCARATADLLPGLRYSYSLFIFSGYSRWPDRPPERRDRSCGYQSTSKSCL